MDVAAPGTTFARFEAVIDEFRRLRHRIARLPRMERAVIEFAGLASRRATCFNAFEVLRVGQDEVVHSGVLAWLLDDAGGHGQGPLFLNLLTGALALPITLDSRHRYLVRREFSGRQSVIDVCVCRPHDFLIYIENKIGAAEGPDQVDRELRDLHRTAEANGVPETRRFAVFLTPEGRRPVSGDPSTWKCLSYGELETAFRTALPAIEDAKAAVFVADWLDTIATWKADT